MFKGRHFLRDDAVKVLLVPYNAKGKMADSRKTECLADCFGNITDVLDKVSRHIQCAPIRVSISVTQKLIDSFKMRVRVPVTRLRPMFELARSASGAVVSYAMAKLVFPHNVSNVLCVFF